MTDLLPPHEPFQPTRRAVLQAAGLAAAGALAVSLPATGQIDSTPPAPPPLPRVDAESVADVAARLGYDQEAIFAFVRDEIGFESYPGVLRGATGTLWARAGNAADQAVLLAELLAAAQVPYRFATGPLSPEQSIALTGLLTPTPEDANAHYREALVAAATHLHGGKLPTDDEVVLTAEEEAQLEAIVTSSRAAASRASELAALSGEAVTTALRAANIGIPESIGAGLTPHETRQHVWIQIPDGPDWIDADPTIPGSEMAVATTEPASTTDTLGDEWHHGVTVRIAIDTLAGTTLSRQELVSLATTSQRVVDVPIAISMAPAEAMAGLGLTLQELFTGQRAVYPVIYADGTVTNAGQAAIFATEGSTVFSAFDEGTPVTGATDGEAVAVWIAVDIQVPDEPLVTVERAVLDRVPAADRASGVIDPARIAPIETHASELDGQAIETIPVFDSLFLVDVVSGRTPGFYASARAFGDPLFGQFGAVGPGIAAMRDGLGLREESAAGIWSYPSAPNVTMLTLAGTEGTSDNRLVLAADLLYRKRAILPLSLDQASDVTIPPVVLAGALEAAAEQALFEVEVSDGVNPGQVFVPAPSIGTVFEGAAAADVEIVAVTSEADLARLTLDEGSLARIRSALAAGLVVVSPTQPVDTATGPIAGWWVFDPASGRTWDQMANGMGFAGIGRSSGRSDARYQSMVEQIIAWWNGLSAARKLACIGMAIGVVGAGVTLGLDLGESGLSAKAFASTLKGIGPVLGSAAACGL